MIAPSLISHKQTIYTNHYDPSESNLCLLPPCLDDNYYQSYIIIHPWGGGSQQLDLVTLSFISSVISASYSSNHSTTAWELRLTSSFEWTFCLLNKNSFLDFQITQTNQNGSKRRWIGIDESFLIRSNLHMLSSSLCKELVLNFGILEHIHIAYAWEH